MTLMISTCRLPHAAIAIQPEGAITADNARHLRDRVTAVLAATKPETVVVDLGAVPAMDEAGADVLAASRDAVAAHDAALVVVDAHPAVYDRISAQGLAGIVATRNWTSHRQER